MNYQSQAMQDRFVASILNFKKDGFFLDIGSCDAVSTNNTYALEEHGWKGICIEIDPAHNEGYKKRSCLYANKDATKVNYLELLEAAGAPKKIDYLSLDVDAASTHVLMKLPLHSYVFSVITIEHDFYIHGGIYRDRQREILESLGYLLLYPDVLVPIQEDTKPNCSFEDWWVHKSIFEKMYPADIIKNLKA